MDTLEDNIILSISVSYSTCLVNGRGICHGIIENNLLTSIYVCSEPSEFVPYMVLFFSCLTKLHGSARISRDMFTWFGVSKQSSFRNSDRIYTFTIYRNQMSHWPYESFGVLFGAYRFFRLLCATVIYSRTTTNTTCIFLFLFFF